MSLDDRDWYRDAIRERDARQNRISGSGIRTVRMSDFSVANSKAAGIMVLFLILFAMVTYVAAYFVPYPATVGFIAVNLLIYILVNSNRMTVNQLGVSCALVKRYKQWYRIVSSEFTHKEVMHIGCNLYSLYNIGSVLEQMIGSVIYIATYFLIGIVSGLISFFIHKKYQPNVVTIGASGIICGLLGVYISIAFYHVGFGVLVSVAPTIVIMILMVFSKHIDSIGHFSGLAVGIASGIAIVKLFY